MSKDKKTLTDNVLLGVVYEGNLEAAVRGVDGAIETALRRQTGLRLGDVSFTKDQNYRVVLEGTQGEVYEGVSTVSIEEAICVATEDQKEFDKEKVVIAVEKTAEAPYFIVPLQARSLSPEKLDEYHSEAVTELLNTYGGRLNQSPDSVEFKVLNMKKQYKHDGMLPKSDFGWVQRHMSIVSEGISKKSLNNAIQNVPPKSKKVKKKIKSTVYEQLSGMVVYGKPEESLKVKEGVALPAVITSMTPCLAAAGHARGASPAGKEPVSLTSSAAFM